MLVNFLEVKFEIEMDVLKSKKDFMIFVSIKNIRHHLFQNRVSQKKKFDHFYLLCLHFFLYKSSLYSVSFFSSVEFFFLFIFSVVYLRLAGTLHSYITDISFCLSKLSYNYMILFSSICNKFSKETAS